MSNYLQGLRHRFHKLGLPVVVTDVQPGFVKTAMGKGDVLFWMASPERAAQQIYDAIRQRRRHVYVTKRWQLVAWFLKIIPERLFEAL